MSLPAAIAQLLPNGSTLPLRVGVSDAAGPALPTGIPELDAMMSGGIPRGRLTEIVGRRGGGRTTLLRRLVERTIDDGGWVAVVDASRTLAPRDWAAVAAAGRLWVVRPEEASRGAWCADVLLRSGAFALVVLDAAPALSRTIAVRLTRLARETGAAFVVAGESSGGRTGIATQLAGALRLRVTSVHRVLDDAPLRRSPRKRRPAPPNPSHGGNYAVPESRRRIEVLVEKGGIHRMVEVSCALEQSRRLCAHPEVPDRRGVARRPAGGSTERSRDDGRAVDVGVGGSGIVAGEGTELGGPPPISRWSVRSVVPSSFSRGRRRNFASPDYPTTRPRTGTLG